MRQAMTLALVFLPAAACGPAVDESGTGDSATSGASVGSTGEDTTDTTESAGSTTQDGSSTEPGDETGTPIGVCGDGQLDAGETCDDGNTENADGCSAGCLASGTIAWTNPLPGGFAVGLDAREGRAVAAVQQFEAAAPTIALSGQDREGNAQGEFLDVGGLSDVDLARAPVALLPDGTVAAGYPVFVEAESTLNRSFGVVSLESGVVWGHTADEARWPRYFGTSWNPAGLFVLHAEAGEDGDVLVLERFEESGEHVSTTALNTAAAQSRPFFRGALPARAFPLASVLTVTPDGGIDLWTHLLSQSSFERYPIGMVAPEARAAAFSDGLFTQVWTGNDLIAIDDLEHVGTTVAHTFEGELLWADLYGLVVSVEDMLVVYDAAGVERFSVELPIDDQESEVLRPAYIRPDADVGLFVLADVGLPVDKAPYSVVMHYIVR